MDVNEAIREHAAVLAALPKVQDVLSKRKVLDCALKYQDAQRELDEASASLVDALRTVCDFFGQKPIAKLFGISPQYLSDILKRRNPISAKFVARVIASLEAAAAARPTVSEKEFNRQYRRI